MENIGSGESSTVPMGSNAIQDALSETNSILRFHAHELQTKNIASGDHSVPSYVERENKRARPWMGGWSNYSNHHFPRTYLCRDNNISRNPMEANGYYGRGSFLAEHPAEGRMEKRWTIQPLIHSRYPQSRTYHRDNLNNSSQLHCYHEDGYYGWNAHSIEQHLVRQYVERDKNWANLGSKSSNYDIPGQPWTNGIQGQPWINIRRRQPWPNYRQRQLWTNVRQQQPWTSDRQLHYWSIRNSPHRYHGQERYGLQKEVRQHRFHATEESNHTTYTSYASQNGIRPYRFPVREESNHTTYTSYASQNGIRPYKFPVREESRIYCGRNMVASTLQAADNVDITSASFGMPSAMSAKNDQAEKMRPVPSEGNPLLGQIEEKCEKFDHDAQQAIERSSFHEQTTLVRPPNACLRKKLLILDVNGLLADVICPPPKEDKADINICRRAIFKRPFVDEFLKFCFERFDVAIWSSRTKKILDRVVDYLMGDMRCKLLFCWDQFHCTKTGFKTLENKHKELVLKEMKKVWEQRDADLSWEKGDYDESNTLLLDDSPYKALLNPMHTAIFPHTYSYKDKSDNSLGSEGDLRDYLQDLAMAENVKRYIEEHPFGQQPIDERSSSWAYYLEVITNQAPVQPQI